MNLFVCCVIFVELGYLIFLDDFLLVDNVEIIVDVWVLMGGKDGVVIVYGGVENGYVVYVFDG